MARKPYRGHGGANPRTFVPRNEAKGMFYSEFQRAEELGRRAAAAAMIADPAARTRVESAFGISYCRSRYPEVYENHVR